MKIDVSSKLCEIYLICSAILIWKNLQIHGKEASQERISTSVFQASSFAKHNFQTDVYLFEDIYKFFSFLTFIMKSLSKQYAILVHAKDVYTKFVLYFLL